MTLEELQKLRTSNTTGQVLNGIFCPISFAEAGYNFRLSQELASQGRAVFSIGMILVVAFSIAFGLWCAHRYAELRVQRVAIDQWIDYGLYKVATDETETVESSNPE